MPFYTLWNGGGLGLLLVALLGLVDVWATPHSSLRGGTKSLWYLVMLVPGFGLGLWIWLGRPRGRRTGGGVGAKRGGANLRVIEGGLSDSEASGLASKERQNADIERTKELNQRLADWERQHERRSGASASLPPASGPQDSEPEVARADVEGAPTKQADASTTRPAAKVPDELSDEELAATLEKWRTEFEG